jgi:hypothetical protein
MYIRPLVPSPGMLARTPMAFGAPAVSQALTVAQSRLLEAALATPGSAAIRPPPAACAPPAIPSGVVAWALPRRA